MSTAALHRQIQKLNRSLARLEERLDAVEDALTPEPNVVGFRIERADGAKFDLHEGPVCKEVK